MMGTLTILLATLAIWMLACGWCGYRQNIVRFLALLLIGLLLNMGWTMLVLNANPFGAHGMGAQIAAVLYVFSAFGTGWLIGRIARQLRESRIDEAGI